MKRLMLAAAVSALFIQPATVQADDSSDKPCKPWPKCLLGDDKPVINPGLPGDPSTPGIRENARPQTFQAPTLQKK